MGWVKQHLTGSFWRIWIMTVLPTAAIFLVAAGILRTLVRMRIALLPEPVASDGLRIFDASFAGTFIGVGFLLSLLVATLLTAITVKKIIFPFTQIARVTGEMAEGNFGVRADLYLSTGKVYQDLAHKINSLAESLERTEQLRREQLANTAHEIRTPLTNLQGYLEALRDGVIEPNHEALESVHEEVMRLVRLVDALHQLARADALRQQPMEVRLTNLDSLAEQLVRVIKPNADARGIKLYFDPGARHIPLPVHADSVAQVMRNLLRNAVQYADEGGVVRIQTHVAQGFYRFTCLNSGAGIPYEDLPFIFQRFYRTARAKQGVGTGVGIGLAIAKELVEAHGGRIGAESRSGWTMVWFELPTEPGQKLGQE